MFSEVGMNLDVLPQTGPNVYAKNETRSGMVKVGHMEELIGYAKG